MVDIVNGIKEIMDKKDPATGSSGGLLTGITKGVNEALDSVLGDIPRFGDPGRNFAFLGTPGEKGGGIHEYQLTRDMGQALGNGFLDSAGPGIGGVVAGSVGAAVAAGNARRMWDTELKEPTVRLNSVLEERSYIDFYFPNLNAGKAGRRRVAFFENPRIKEDRSARYSAQNIVARNEPARLFTGADARKVSVQFTYTLPHVDYFFKMCNDAALAGFSMTYPVSQTDEIGLSNRPRGAGPGFVNGYKDFVKRYLDKTFGTSFEVVTSPAQVGVGISTGLSVGSFGLLQVDPQKIGILSFRNDGTSGPRAYEPTRQESKPGYGNPRTSTHEERLFRSISNNQQDLDMPTMMAVYYTLFVIDTIRASVIGDTLKAGPAGPPIVRFRHGAVFNEAPFIVRSYSVDYPSDKGYEYRTLLPRQIRFSLNLEEFRQTHGSHHGDENYQVPEVSDVLDLEMIANNENYPINDRLRSLEYLNNS